MSITDRDRKILMVLAPILLLAAYWLLMLAPKREEAAKAGQELARQEKARDSARAELARLRAAKSSFAADYAQVVRLGKAIPSKVDMPGLLVQLEEAATGTDIEFDKISTPDDAAAAGASSAGAPPPAAGGGGGSQPAASGGKPAQTTPGKQAEGAADGTNAASKQGAGGAAGTGAAGSAATAGGASGSCPPGLACVPLELEFSGRFFDLVGFFHRLKQFVRVADDHVRVSGRLVAVRSLRFSSDGESFPGIKAEMDVTVYLAPDPGGSAGGPPGQAPSTAVSASTGPAGSAPGSSAAPTAAAAP